MKFLQVFAFTACALLGLAKRSAAAPIANTQYAGYLFAYFIGEGYSNGEQIYFAVSQGTDPSRWTELNGGRPVLTSTVGTRGARDPSIVRVGDGFKVIATDLKMYGSGDWGASIRNGSLSIVVWDSPDLVSFSASRLARVSPKNAGNTWAPEAIYDPVAKTFQTFWASSLYAASDPAHAGQSHNRILAAATSDFRTFAPARTYDDPGYDVIDTTMIQTPGGTLQRFSKDERSNSPDAPDGKFIFQESAPAFAGPWTRVAAGIGKGVIARGEGPTVFADIAVPGRYHLFIDEFGGRGYVPFQTDDIASGKWIPSVGYQLPQRPRHGSVIPITAAEMAAVMTKWGPH